MIKREEVIDQLLLKINEVRLYPMNYIGFLNERKASYHTNCIYAEKHIIRSMEGLHPIDYLISDLSTPVGGEPLRWSYGLHTVADVFAHDLGMTGSVGHRDSRGRELIERLREYCHVRGKVVYLQQIGGQSAKYILAELLIDDGLVTRSRRRNLLDPHFKHIGIAIAPHSQYGYISVLILAEEAYEIRKDVLTVEYLIEVPISKPTAYLITHTEVRRMAEANPQVLPERSGCFTC